MTTTENADTLLLGTYTADGYERELHAVRIPSEALLQIIDVLSVPLAEDGDLDVLFVDDDIATVAEARALAADYIAQAKRARATPTPDPGE
jgi:hypothetical protein